ncbi:hypothetical protein AVEN_270024-1 [Araneus ventricosus]|uniref:Uncharacterized protein n=1 Tax=Araneus ventricosus TaxID=182803 RepID=A0A4Y2H0Z6_ARAVE|nr:hypothetical protein AVEN_270024-1 [Araneus ventricosus]
MSLKSGHFEDPDMSLKSGHMRASYEGWHKEARDRKEHTLQEKEGVRSRAWRIKPNITQVRVYTHIDKSLLLPKVLNQKTLFLEDMEHNAIKDLTRVVEKQRLLLRRGPWNYFPPNERDIAGENEEHEEDWGEEKRPVVGWAGEAASTAANLLNDLQDFYFAREC